MNFLIPDKENLTDAEITKALKDLLELMLHEGDMQRTSIISKALDLINRQKAEIDGLIAGQETLQKCIADKMAEIEKLKKDIQESNILIDMQDKVLREQTELIEELKEEKDRLRYNLKMVCKEQDEDNIRADAIKEFAEKLKEIIKQKRKNVDALLAKTRYGECILAIDNLIKEMVGEDK